MMGISSIELREPSLHDLRKVKDLNTDNHLRMTEFLSLITDKDQLNQITPFDRDYLFFLAVSSISLNTLNYSTTCPSCSKNFPLSISSSEMEPIYLPTGVPRTVTKTIFNTPLTFTKISVEQETFIIENAIKAPDDEYDDTYFDNLVSYTLYQDFDHISEVQSLDIAVYYLAVFYHAFSPHGIHFSKQVQCPSCSHEFDLTFPIDASLLAITPQQIMSVFTTLSGSLTLTEFYDLTIPELNLLITNLNMKRSQE